MASLIRRTTVDFQPMYGLDKQTLYKIVVARDKRYDGRFYCGVHTTGIYCRPICPARPKVENISFYRSATEAEKEGFRPCLRCRPDLSPTSIQWQGTAAIIGRALTMISAGDVDDKNIRSFAEKFGMSDRHFRRLFEEHLGASPIEVALSKRLHLAKQLLMQSSLPITDIGYAAGFQSIRRFNDAFKQKFKEAPSKFRKSVTSKDLGFIEIELPYIAPFDWDFTYSFLQNHGAHGVEDFYAGKYSRVFSINGKQGSIELSNDPKKNCLNLRVASEDVTILKTIIEKTKDIFDLRLNPHQLIGDLCKEVKSPYEKVGIRIPGAWDSFETAVCIILGQLVSTEQAKSKVKKLIQLYGRPVKSSFSNGLTHLFPTPQDLIGADLKPIGLTKIREAAIKSLAQEVLNKKIDLSRIADISDTREKLLAIKGIGPWTTEMIAMRCLGDTNALPKTDLIIKRAMDANKWTHEVWSPWSAYVTLSIWKKYATQLSRKKVKT